jgi:O-antigen/teichoic acid export membrane protein
MSAVDAYRGPRAQRIAAFADQALSGLSNFLTVVLVARSVDAEGFGRFAVVYAAFTALLGLARQLWGTRISLTASADQARRQAAGFMGAAVCVTPLGLVLIGLPSVLLIGWHAAPLIAVLVVALPVVLAQDLSRYAGIASGRAQVAMLSDLTWVVIVGAACVLRPPFMLALAAWAGGAVLALLVSLAALRLAPDLAGGWAALRHRHATGEVTALGFVSASIGSYVTLGLATLALGAAAAGSLRGAATVMAPINTLFAFTGVALLPSLFRAARERQPRVAVRMSLGLTGATAAWGLLLLLLPAATGRAVLGESWAGARAVLPWTATEYLGLAAAIGAVLGLQALGAARLLAQVLLPGTGFVIAGVVLAAVIGTTATAFAAALAVAAWLYAVLGWTTYARRRRADSSETMDLAPGRATTG